LLTSNNELLNLKYGATRAAVNVGVLVLYTASSDCVEFVFGK
jgi:hypothetical protein